MSGYHPAKCWREPGHERCAAALLEVVVADAGIAETQLDFLASHVLLPDPEDRS